ncbi:DUF550 domain-containing protein [Salmonella enterica]|nr:DUF550 domain-containing protein [Salmonella enterica]EIZ6791790.1 DUF550 domain-containing protein [Salmonella enterica]EJR6246907.1 DUF550 domain-containing protein [Salmonella enterica]
MTTITREEVKAFIEQIESDLSNGWEAQIFELKLARIALASLDAEPVSQPYKLPEEKGASLQLRNLIRKRHAEWSDSTFGNVGPVGPLKHLSKEALEAAAEPGDLSEWADMQFLLWDAQRRAGISDGEITAAMEEKLKVNMARQWPEPKDGEPRLHIKEQPAPVVPPAIEPDYKVIKGILPTANPDEYACCIAADMWNACRAAMLQGDEPVSQTYNLPELIEGMEVSIDVSTCDADAGNRYFGTVTEVSELYTAKNGYILLVQDAKPNFDVNGNTPVQSPIDHGYRPECECSGCKATARICAELNNEEAEIFADGYNAAMQSFGNSEQLNSPVTPDGWISCSERMPNDKDYVWCWGKSYGWTECDTFEGYYDWSRNKWWAVTDDVEEPASKVTHWMPLPEPPQEVK